MHAALLLAALLAGPVGALTPPPPGGRLPGPPRLEAGELPPLPARDARRALDAWLEAHPAPSPHPEPAYHFLSELLSEAVEALDGGLARGRVFELGRSLRGRPIWGFALRHPLPVRHRVLVVASIHPLEWLPSELALRLLQRFAAHPEPGLEVVFVPVLNVDTRLRVESDLLSGRRRYRRGNAAGVDLNRDFAVHHEATSFWRHLLPRYHAASPAPLSQPESRALDRLASSAPFDLAVSLHAFGGFAYAPWAGRWERPPDWAALRCFGALGVAAQGAHAYHVRELSHWGFFFRAQGTELDQLYGAHGIPSYLVELGRSGIEPLHPSSWRDPFRLYNPRDPSRVLRQGTELLEAWFRVVAAEGFPGTRCSSDPRGVP